MQVKYMIWNNSKVEQWEDEVTYLMFVLGEGDNTRKNFNMPLFPCFACEMTRSRGKWKECGMTRGMTRGITSCCDTCYFVEV